MRKITVLFLTSALAACGGSSSSGPSGISGTVGGKTFTTQGEVAFFGSGANCPFTSGATSVSVGTSLAVAEVTNYALTCSAATTCALKASSMTLTLLIARANYFSPATAPGLGSGSYGYIDLFVLAGGGTPTLPQPDAAGNLSIFTALLLDVGPAPTCTPAAPIQITQGALNVTASSATSISGTVSLTFKDGSSLSGSFTAASCPGVPNFDACSALGSILGSGSGGAGPDFCQGSAPTCT